VKKAAEGDHAPSDTQAAHQVASNPEISFANATSTKEKEPAKVEAKEREKEKDPDSSVVLAPSQSRRDQRKFSASDKASPLIDSGAAQAKLQPPRLPIIRPGLARSSPRLSQEKVCARRDFSPFEHRSLCRRR
jgi:hypothetical protein